MKNPRVALITANLSEASLQNKVLMHADER
jgi:hypothetical protein